MDQYTASGNITFDFAVFVFHQLFVVFLQSSNISVSPFSISSAIFVLYDHRLVIPALLSEQTISIQNIETCAQNFQTSFAKNKPIPLYDFNSGFGG